MKKYGLFQGGTYSTSMSTSGVSAAARAVAFGVVLLLLAATLAVLVVSLRLGADVRQRLQAVDDQIARLSQSTDAESARVAAGIGELSEQLTALSGSMRTDIGSVGRSTRADVTRLRDRLAGRLDDMARRMSDLAEQPREVVMVPAPSASASTPAPSAVASPVSTALLSSTTAAEADLSSARQSSEAAQCFETGRYEQAQRAFARILSERPSDHSARLYYAASLYRANPGDSSRYAQVERNLRSVLETDPHSVLALDTLASLEVEQGRWTDALGHLRRLAALEPRNPRYHLVAGFCALKAADPAAARDSFAAAVDLAPTDPRALTSLGDCEWALGHASEARRSWKAALTLLDTGTPSGARASAELRAKLSRTAAGEMTP